LGHSLKMDEIVIVAYDPRWPQLFEQEAARIRRALGDGLLTRIEHFGSTAVPGLAAKPVIDILVGVRSLEEARRIAIPALDTLGYAYWYDNPDQEHMFFVKGLPPNGPRSHHIHMVEPQSIFWERLLFRDYLRKHPEEAARYLALKREMAVYFMEDREAYTDAKGEYIHTVTAKAKTESDTP
jgi:GrpB-like predicted nucleotidyltransferase (UPF0157 family)